VTEEELGGGLLWRRRKEVGEGESGGVQEREECQGRAQGKLKR